jgi:NAD(P)-dependent dehydrogenase (short-subunit alcohol dehydrogenase family)
MRLDGMSIAITGAAGSLGSALALAFAEAGAARVTIGDLDPTRLVGLGQEIEGLGCRAITCALDVTDPSSLDAFVDQAAAGAARLDVMVNNAGVLNATGRIHNLDDEEWQRVLDVNLMGAVRGTRSAVRIMRGQEKGGVIINTASAAGQTAWAYSGPYCVSKAAVIHLTRVAALEYARDRIRVNCVCPGTFLSNIHAGLPQEAIDRIAERHPLGLGNAQNVVGAFIYLASDGARWTTGAAITVDGGYSLP